LQLLLLLRRNSKPNSTTISSTDHGLEPTNSAQVGATIQDLMSNMLIFKVMEEPTNTALITKEDIGIDMLMAMLASVALFIQLILLDGAEVMHSGLDLLISLEIERLK